MKLEVGKKYKDWGGEVVTIIGFDESDNTYAGDDGTYYTEDGGLYGCEELVLEEEPVFDPISELHAGKKVVWHTATEDGDDIDYVVSIRSENECRWLLIDGEEQSYDLTNECHRELVLFPGQFEEYDDVELVDGEWYWIALNKTDVMPARYGNEVFSHGGVYVVPCNCSVIAHIDKPEFV